MTSIVPKYVNFQVMKMTFRKYATVLRTCVITKMAVEILMVGTLSDSVTSQYKL